MTRSPLKRGYCLTPLVRRLEEEYGQTLPEIIKGYVDDGLNKSMVAGILEHNRNDFWRKLNTMARAGITFDWPCGYATRDLPPQVTTQAQLDARIANLDKAREANAEYWRTHRVGNHALAAAAHGLRLQRLSWLAIATRLNVTPSTLLRARKRYKVGDPLGRELQIAAQRKFSGSKSFAQRTGAKQC
jgi:hypothetical protein